MEYVVVIKLIGNNYYFIGGLAASEEFEKAVRFTNVDEAMSVATKLNKLIDRDRNKWHVVNVDSLPIK